MYRKIHRKTTMLLIILALTFSGTASVFTQDAAPATPEDENAARSLYLPLVEAGQQTAAETEVSTDAANTVEAGSSQSGARNNRCGDGGGRRRGNLEVVGLTTDQRLICFDETNPSQATTIGTVAGLTVDTSLVGIDFRPASGELYGLGNAGGVYTLNIDTAQATLRSRLNVALSGSFFGVDFNPVVDRLRIISDNGQNLRANVDDGTTNVDGSLAYTPGTPATGVAGAAYTNNDSDPNTATTLYDIDSMLDQVAIQSPANSGQLVATGKLTVDTTAAIGFDIYSTVRNGSTTDIRALASLVVDGRARFYGIMLFTGKASLRGTFNIQNQVIGIAIPLNQL